MTLTIIFLTFISWIAILFATIVSTEGNRIVLRIIKISALAIPTFVSLILLATISLNVWTIYQNTLDFNPRNNVHAQTETEIKIVEQYSRAIEDINLKTSTALSILGIAITVLVAIQIKNWVDAKEVEELQKNMSEFESRLKENEKNSIKNNAYMEVFEKRLIENDKVYKNNLDKLEEQVYISDKLLWAKIEPNNKIQYYYDILNKYSNNVMGYLLLGTYFLENSSYKEAMFLFDEAIRINPENVEAYNSRGLLYTEKGQQEEALKDFNKAIELDSKNTIAYFRRYKLNIEMGRDKEAIEDYEKLKQLNSDFI